MVDPYVSSKKVFMECTIDLHTYCMNKINISNKKVLIGITGGIACYKIPELIRLFIKNKNEVKVIVTTHALQFITKLTLQTVSQNIIYSEMFTTNTEITTEHISLTQWCDVFIIAPATANIIGKLSNGIADDMLSTTLLACKKPIFICPAMNENMYTHFSVQKNITYLKQNNIQFIGPITGMLACNTEGIGKMEEPLEIYNSIVDFFKYSQDFKDKKIIITAGPTYEKFDAVRFIGNFSSGKMGVCIAEEFAKRGAHVILIIGPSQFTHIIKIFKELMLFQLKICLILQ